MSEEIEQTEEYKSWERDLINLDNKINSLSVWDDYAERLQSRYDDLLKEDPRIKKDMF